MTVSDSNGPVSTDESDGEWLKSVVRHLSEGDTVVFNDRDRPLTVEKVDRTEDSTEVELSGNNTTYNIYTSDVATLDWPVVSWPSCDSSRAVQHLEVNGEVPHLLAEKDVNDLFPSQSRDWEDGRSRTPDMDPTEGETKGKCPGCGGEVIEYREKRVVCTDCGRWCDPEQWTEWEGQ